mmetsp:Transcript_20467/g.44428  ORF Transcript_20467/g.44428 Transcript_20467/m.44428 type:complete len:162 (-) Transcript_20467:7-492(-)
MKKHRHTPPACQAPNMRVYPGMGTIALVPLPPGWWNKKMGYPLNLLPFNNSGFSRNHTSTHSTNKAKLYQRPHMKGSILFSINTASLAAAITAKPRVAVMRVELPGAIGPGYKWADNGIKTNISKAMRQKPTRQECESSCSIGTIRRTRQVGVLCYEMRVD